MCCRAASSRHRELIFRDLPSNNVLISDNSQVRKNYFLSISIHLFVTDTLAVAELLLFELKIMPSPLPKNVAPGV